MKTILLEKLEAIAAAGNNGYARFDCMREAQLRRLMQCKAELEARGNVVFTENAVYTAAGFAAAVKTSNQLHSEAAAKAKQARKEADAKAEQQQRGDYALNAMLARAEAMTMTA